MKLLERIRKSFTELKDRGLKDRKVKIKKERRRVIF